jgi:hypothetical protein
MHVGRRVNRSIGIAFRFRGTRRDKISDGTTILRGESGVSHYVNVMLLLETVGVRMRGPSDERAKKRERSRSDGKRDCVSWQWARALRRRGLGHGRFVDVSRVALLGFRLPTASRGVAPRAQWIADPRDGQRGLWADDLVALRGWSGSRLAREAEQPHERHRVPVLRESQSLEREQPGSVLSFDRFRVAPGEKRADDAA